MNKQDRKLALTILIKRALLQKLPDVVSQKILDKSTVMREQWLKQDRKERARIIREKKQDKTLEGLIINLSQNIATQKIVIKQKITDKIKAEEHTIFKPYVNNLTNAAASNDPIAIKDAIKTLQKMINDYAEQDPSVIVYKENSNMFYKFRNQANIVEKSKVINTLGPVPVEIGAIIDNVIRDGSDLINRFSQVKHFTTVVESIGAIIELLILRKQQMIED